MLRTIAASHEFDWLPPELRRIKTIVKVGVIVPLVAATGVLLWLAPGAVYGVGKALVGLGVLGGAVGDKIARRRLAGRIARMAQGHGELAELKAKLDGEWVHVRGTVVAPARPATAGPDDRGVYRKLWYSVGAVGYVHEHAVDFQLVDENGERVHVETEHARLLVPSPKKVRVLPASWDELAALPLPGAAAFHVARKFLSKPTVRVYAAEFMLKDGAQIYVFAQKSRVVDSTVADRLSRDTPFRTTLRGGKQMPLLIVPVS